MTTRANSRGRHAALTSWQAPFTGSFDWVGAPVLNRYTRIAVEMCAARGILRVAGYESVPGFELPQQVTQIREVCAEPDGCAIRRDRDDPPRSCPVAGARGAPIGC